MGPRSTCAASNEWSLIGPIVELETLEPQHRPSSNEAPVSPGTPGTRRTQRNRLPRFVPSCQFQRAAFETGNILRVGPLRGRICHPFSLAVLPAAIPDTPRCDLRIGLSLKQADALMMPPVYLPIASSLEGQPVLYETRFARSACRL
jgi:hypothetical protein